jgi:hypothetical protein
MAETEGGWAAGARGALRWLLGWTGPSAPAPEPPAPWPRLLPPALAGSGLGLLLLLATLAGVGFEPTGPFSVGTSFGLAGELAGRGVRVVTVPGVGYDGQWYLALATDPLLREGVSARFDDPRYRAGRPLEAWAGWLLAAGRPGWLPAGLLAVGPLALLLGGAATARVATAFGRSRWWGLAFAAVPGVVAGVVAVTAEPLALALAVLGLALVLDRRLAAAGAAFAAAALTKETYLAFAAAAALHLLLERPAPAGRRLARAATVLLPGALALAAWWAYLVGRVATRPGLVDRTSGVLLSPLDGWWGWLRALAAGRYLPATLPAPAAGAFLLACLALVAAGTLLGLRHRTLPARAGLLLGGYAASLDGAAFAPRFFSAMRVLAPCVLAGLLALVAAWRPRASGPAPAARAAPAAAPGRGGGTGA